MSQPVSIEYTPIGVIHTPFMAVEGMPIQPPGAKGVQGYIEMSPVYQDGLKDLMGFSHVILLYHFHESRGYALQVKPFLDDERHGVFATRAPKRPNPIGLSVVRLTNLNGNIVYIEDVDVLDGTPLLDIKPYVPQFDHRENARTGWLEKQAERVREIRADDHFVT